MDKPTRKERKRKIKDGNANRKQTRRPFEPKTPEEFNRQMEGFSMLVLGLLKVAGIDPARLIEKADEFPSELDLDGPR